MNTGPDRRKLLRELLVAEVLARRGEGPLARKRWPRLRPDARVDPGAGERAVQARDAGAANTGR